MSECKNKECTREAYVLDKPYCSSMCCISDLERQLAEAREFIIKVGHHIDGYMLNNNSLHAMSRIMKHYDKLKEQGDE